jgi:hypothetical protein
MGPRYLDPATGSYVFQMLVAGVLGALYAVRGFFFGPPASEEPEEEDEEGADAAPEGGAGADQTRRD